MAPPPTSRRPDEHSKAQRSNPQALPDGSGAGTPYTQELEPWVLQGAAREAKEAPGLEAGREKEAFERALAAALASPEDPEFHYRAWEAKEKAGNLKKAAAAGNLVSALGTLFGTLADYIDGWIEVHVADEVPFEWLEEYGQFLEACVRELHDAKDSHGGCEASYESLPVFDVPDFWSKPVISYCFNGKPSPDALDGLELSGCYTEAYLEELGPGTIA